MEASLAEKIVIFLKKRFLEVFFSKMMKVTWMAIACFLFRLFTINDFLCQLRNFHSHLLTYMSCFSSFFLNRGILVYFPILTGIQNGRITS